MVLSENKQIEYPPCLYLCLIRSRSSKCIWDFGFYPCFVSLFAKRSISLATNSTIPGNTINTKYFWLFIWIIYIIILTGICPTVNKFKLPLNLAPHLCFKQLQPKMCCCPKVEYKVENRFFTSWQRIFRQFKNNWFVISPKRLELLT